MCVKKRRLATPCVKLLLFWVDLQRGVMNILIVEVVIGPASLVQEHFPQAGLSQDVMDTAHSQGLMLPKLVSAAHCLGHGL